MKYVEELKQKALKGDKEAAYKYDRIMNYMDNLDCDKVANSIILMKELIPELDNQSALLIKKYVIEPDRSLDYLSRDEVSLIEFLRNHLKDAPEYE